MLRAVLTLPLLVLLSGCEASPDAAQPTPKPPNPRPAVPAPAVTSAPKPAATPSRACDDLSFFDIYRQADALTHESSTKVQLALRIDLHAADCGAPDGYGHDTKLDLQLSAKGSQCLVDKAHAFHTFFGEEGHREGPKRWESVLVPDSAPDLADPNLKEIVLRSAESREAIRLERTNYFYFEGLSPGQKLAPHLQGDSSPKGPAYGYTSSESSRWHTTYWLSPIAFSSAQTAKQEELDAYNRWATENRLRGDLPKLLERTFGTDEPEYKIGFSNGTPPMAAKVVYDRKQFPADSRADPKNFERRILEYSRKSCDDCEGGTTGWWLWASRTEWHCANDSNKLEVSDYRCGSWEQVNGSAQQ